MTAEVAILNKLGVALAADSAASIGDDAEKIYHTNKLFGLSTSCPVGVMIYDSADHLMTPLEIIIKLFREHCRDAPEPTVRQYVDKFLAFLSDKRFLNETTERAHIRQVVVRLLLDVKDKVDELAIDVIQRTRNYPRKSLERLLLDVIGHTVAELRREEPIKSLAGISNNQIIETYKNEISEATRAIFPDLSFDGTLRQKLHGLISLLLSRGRSNFSSGIVITGFGEDEVFPHLIHLRIDGSVCGKLKYRELRDDAIDPIKKRAWIYPFAQREMVARFMAGVDEAYLDWIDQTSRRVLGGFAEELVKTTVPRGARRNKALAQLPGIVDEAIQEFSDSSERFRNRRFVKPVLDMVEFLPKEELANMAEALVSLTSIKRRVSNEKETVGGPIDVAVISKGDGFIWIKRKQYFSAEMNPQFVARYQARKE
jgi:hypothetical protein